MLIIIIIYLTKFIDKSVEPNVVEESGAHHSKSIFAQDFTFPPLKYEVVTSSFLLTVQSTRSLIETKILHKLQIMSFEIRISYINKKSVKNAG